MTTGIDSYIREQFGVADVDVRTYSPLTLAYIGEGLKQYEDSIKMVAVIGHTADPMDGEERNSGWMLSGERASSICSYFEYDMGFEPTKLMLFRKEHGGLTYDPDKHVIDGEDYPEEH